MKKIKIFIEPWRLHELQNWLNDMASNDLLASDIHYNYVTFVNENKPYRYYVIPNDSNLKNSLDYSKSEQIGKYGDFEIYRSLEDLNINYVTSKNIKSQMKKALKMTYFKLLLHCILILIIIFLYLVLPINAMVVYSTFFYILSVILLIIKSKEVIRSLHNRIEKDNLLIFDGITSWKRIRNLNYADIVLRIFIIPIIIFPFIYYIP